MQLAYTYADIPSIHPNRINSTPPSELLRDCVLLRKFILDSIWQYYTTQKWKAKYHFAVFPHWTSLQIFSEIAFTHMCKLLKLTMNIQSNYGHFYTFFPLKNRPDLMTRES